jgi:hypothetical protein
MLHCCSLLVPQQLRVQPLLWLWLLLLLLPWLLATLPRPHASSCVLQQ